MILNNSADLAKTELVKYEILYLCITCVYHDTSNNMTLRTLQWLPYGKALDVHLV